MSMTIQLPGFSTSSRPGKILCIGKNYARHVDEMQGEADDVPIVFLKPPSALVGNGGSIVLPPHSQEVHHELELVVGLSDGGKNIPEEDALNHVAGYAVGLDMTARDLQTHAKDNRQPWSVAKGFDTFAVLGDFGSGVSDPQDLTLHLDVNGETRQESHTRHMIFTVAEIISYCSTVFTLEAGDLIYTGTPEGVGPVQAGDELEAEAEGLPPLRVDVVEQREHGEAESEAE